MRYEEALRMHYVCVTYALLQALRMRHLACVTRHYVCASLLYGIFTLLYGIYTLLYGIFTLLYGIFTLLYGIFALLYGIFNRPPDALCSGHALYSRGSSRAVPM